MTALAEAPVCLKQRVQAGAIHGPEAAEVDHEMLLTRGLSLGQGALHERDGRHVQFAPEGQDQPFAVVLELDHELVRDQRLKQHDYGLERAPRAAQVGYGPVGESQRDDQRGKSAPRCRRVRGIAGSTPKCPCQGEGGHSARTARSSCKRTSHRLSVTGSKVRWPGDETGPSISSPPQPIPRPRRPRARERARSGAYHRGAPARALPVKDCAGHGR
jgi:hypothetical protein